MSERSLAPYSDDHPHLRRRPAHFSNDGAADFPTEEGTAQPAPSAVDDDPPPSYGSLFPSVAHGSRAPDTESGIVASSSALDDQLTQDTIYRDRVPGGEDSPSHSGHVYSEVCFSCGVGCPRVPERSHNDGDANASSQTSYASGRATPSVITYLDSPCTITSGSIHPATPDRDNTSLSNIANTDTGSTSYGGIAAVAAAFGGAWFLGTVSTAFSG
ncbi:hypothetical protein IAT40_000655 [Kwoniella sp. CBS 6097]